MHLRLSIPAVILTAALTQNTAAQEATPLGPCAVNSCNLFVEWGPSGPPLGLDRRYGAVAEYQQRLIAALVGAGQKFTDAESKDALFLILRPRVVSAMCDVMAGTNTDRGCQMIEEIDVEVRNADPALKLPKSFRIRNRCADDSMMDVARFSDFSMGTITYELNRNDPKRKRPLARCR